MKIGIDILGGDFAPDANIARCCYLLIRSFLKDVRLVLIGDQDQILSWLNALDANPADFDIVHAPDVITMHDHPTRASPAKAQQQYCRRV